MNESRSTAAARPTTRTEARTRAGAAGATRTRAGAAAARAGVEVAAEEATTWGRDVVDDVAGDGAIDGDAMSARYRAPAVSAEPPLWR